MLKRIARAILPQGEAAFEGYYQRVVLADSQTAPTADEARRDFRESLRAGLSGLI